MDNHTINPSSSAMRRLYGSEPAQYSNYIYQPYRHQSEQVHISSQGDIDPRTVLRPNYYHNTIKPPPEQPLLQQAMPAPIAQAYLPFRPSNPAPSVFAAIPAPLKIDTSPLLPTPQVLPGEVDVFKYEPIEMEEWLKAPTEYTSSPPDTASSPTDGGPSTPPSFAYVNPGLRRYSSYSDTDEIVHHAFAQNSFQPALEKLYPERYETFPQYPPGPLPLDSQSFSIPGWTFAPPHGLPSQAAINRFQPEPVSASPQDIEHPSFIPRPHSSYSTSSASTDEATEDQQLPVASPAAAPEPASTVDTVKRNDLLLDLRNKGHSYKDIKRIGKFREAESTLRGRVRMLTKEKWERVRKPQWKPADLALLRRAVTRLRPGTQTRRAKQKIPWKKVGEWMQEHGSSYTFAPATCAKKWEEMPR